MTLVTTTAMMTVVMMGMILLWSELSTTPKAVEERRVSVPKAELQEGQTATDTVLMLLMVMVMVVVAVMVVVMMMMLVA
jgi:hypothetical protein